MAYDVTAIVLGGGQGTRLFPLTAKRAKPAVPIGGKYRLIDVPISNCLNSEINHIYILTQFMSVSLHRHIHNAYKLDVFSGGFVYILAAQQTTRGMDWYQGTADAVRKQLPRLMQPAVDDFVILSGDHLYRMDYSEFVDLHRDKRADVTVAVQPVSREEASRFGILKTNKDGVITTFVEKPSSDQLDGLESLPNTDKPFLGSMGIYVFRQHVLQELLEGSEAEDFGREIIPEAIDKMRVCAYPFKGYWEDIGTIRSFYDANLNLTEPHPKFDFYDPNGRIYTRPRFLPSTRADKSELIRTVLSDGCLIQGAKIQHSVLGLRSLIETETQISDAILMGADFYETPAQKAQNGRKGRPNVGIGRGTQIEAAIIDKNARIGAGVQIKRRSQDSPDETHENWSVREGIVVVPKNATIPDGTVI